jgi:8-oxo-dGTP pyrophosphatase MutT (NUDIX family)
MSAVVDVQAIERRLRRAVRALDDPPTMPGWNAAELADVLEPDVPRREAAVLVPFVRRAEALSMLFTRRTDDLRTHAGQVSFPGGGIESGDVDAVAAALRETREETGIAPALVEPFGFLDSFETVSGYRVTPVVGFVSGDYVSAPDPTEVAEVFEVPVDYVFAPGRLIKQRIEWRGRLRDIYEFDWEGRRVWGATASMLLNLLQRLERVP